MFTNYTVQIFNVHWLYSITNYTINSFFTKMTIFIESYLSDKIIDFDWVAVMELCKIEDVDFSINHGLVFEEDINLVWNEGGLYLSLRNIMLTDGKRWYDIPIKELENVQVISDNPIKLRFQLPSLEVIVTGKNAERLLALRYLLLPYIHPKRREKMKDSLKGLIKFWCLGIRSVTAFSSLLPLTAEEARKLIASAREVELITQEGRLTDKAYEMFSPTERELLRSLEVIDG